MLNEINHYKSARFCHKSQKPSCRSGSYLKSKTQENMTWIYIPQPSNSQHQVYPTFSRESQLKPSNNTGILGRGEIIRLDPPSAHPTGHLVPGSFNSGCFNRMCKVVTLNVSKGPVEREHKRTNALEDI